MGVCAVTAAEGCYVPLARSGELTRRAEAARGLLSPCRVCPRECGVDRPADERGFCRTGARARVSHAGAHFGEEPPLAHAGAVFFAGCNLACAFCQNHQISQTDAGREMTACELAQVFLDLQAQGCRNLDLVSPTHVAPQILQAVALAANEGLRLPIVYNSGGYDSVETLRLFDGVVDVYLPDAKYGANAPAMTISGVDDYVKANRAALREMLRQTGPLRTDVADAPLRGLIVRHLVLPNGLSGTRSVLRFVAEDLSPAVPVSLMAQYAPRHRAADFPQLRRPVSPSEYEQALEAFDEAGLETAFTQTPEARDTGAPDFDRGQPFEW